MLCNLIEYRDNYSETSGRLWHRDEPSDPIDNSESFKSKIRITRKILSNG